MCRTTDPSIRLCSEFCRRSILNSVLENVAEYWRLWGRLVVEGEKGADMAAERKPMTVANRSELLGWNWFLPTRGTL